MSLLALDLGTAMGYAASSSGVIVSGTVNFAPKRFEGGGMRFLKLRRWLEELHSAQPVTEVVFEEVRRHRGTDAAHCYGGLLGVLTAWCEEKGIPYEGITVQAIKKFATGKGAGPSTKKEHMIAAVKEKWGFNPKDDNEADALALLHLRMYEVLK